MGGGVGKRHPDQLGLGAVDPVPEDPTATPEALAVTGLPAEPAGPARRDAGHEDPVADRDVAHRAPDRLDGTDGLVAQDAAVGHRGHVALEDVQVRAADGHRVDPDDGVGVVADDGVRDLLPGRATGTVVDDCMHGGAPV